MRATSPGESATYQRETVKIPVGVSRSRKTCHASAVYSPFSERLNAPAPVEAQVSIIDMVMTSYLCRSRAMKLRASSPISSTPGISASRE